jgi:circadian clock protein KaiC
MKKRKDLARIETGIPNLDGLLRGGIPKGALVVLAGPPGTGKTTLAQQLCFHHASEGRRAIYFSTLSEPTAKTLRYLSTFQFFDPDKVGTVVEFIDLGMILRTKGLDEAAQLLMREVKRVAPALVVIDSFRVFDDLKGSRDELRRFSYEVAVNLMAWETTTLLLGEYSTADIEINPLFSIADGLFTMNQRAQGGENQRFIQIVKMRGTDHSRDEHPFVLNSNGLEIFAPRVMIRRESLDREVARIKTGISKLDDLLGDGIPTGSSLLISGVAGTGKTVLLLEFIYRGALRGEKGVFFSFEETEPRLRAAARGLGWDLDREIDRGMIEIVFIPQPEIMVEGDLVRIAERIKRHGASRVAVDSISVFLHKIGDPQVAREKVFHLASVVQNTSAVGFFSSDVRYGDDAISRFGIEETVVDGVIVLSAPEEGLERHRFIEIYKLRNTAHLAGRHSLQIAPGGVRIFPRYEVEKPEVRRASGKPRARAAPKKKAKGTRR